MGLVHEEMVAVLHEIHRSLGRYARDVVAEYDLPLSQLMISRHIKAEPGITISELARRTGIVKSHISNQIGKLEERGWVEKKSDENDQRILRLYLSEPASHELFSLGAKIRERFNSLVADIPEDRAEELLAALQEIKQAMDRNRCQYKSEFTCHGEE